jgi:hypothetical protein
MNPASTRRVSLSGQRSTPTGCMCGPTVAPIPRKGKLTGRQETFCKLIVEGILSNAECARQSGYAAETAGQYAAKLLNGQDFPHVVERITELREERQRRYGVTTIGQLERLAKLSKGAEDAGQFSAAINAEKIQVCNGRLDYRPPRDHQHARPVVAR